MAYLVELEILCNHVTCRQWAVVIVRNRANADLGSYCRVHGRAALRRQLDAEERQDRDQKVVDRHGY